MSDENLHCSACLEDKHLVRILKCKHEMCESCCILHLYEPKYVVGILCPVDQEITGLGDAGIDGIKDLPKKLSVELSCSNCLNVVPIQNQWWCDECNETVCSLCAMKKHRSHDCSSLEGETIVKNCLQIFKPYCKIAKNNVADEIDKFCVSLANELKNRLSAFDEAINFVTVVESVYGSNISTTAGSSVDEKITLKNLKKKLSLLNSIVSSIQSDNAFDVDQLLKLAEIGFNSQLTFPTVNSLADSFFKPESTSTSVPPKSNVEEELRFSPAPSSSNGSSSNPAAGEDGCKLSVDDSLQFQNNSSENVTTQQVPTVAKSEKFELKWKLSLKCNDCPFSLCAVPMVGVVLSNAKGVHLLDQQLKYVQFKGWPVAQYNPPEGFGYAPSIVYHPKRKSVLILKEFNNKHADSKKIIELQVPSFVRLTATSYPVFPDNHRRLLGVLKSGSVVCATSSMIWLKQLEPPKAESVVWTRNINENFDCFTDLALGPLSSKGNEVIFFTGKRAIYQFTVFRNYAQLQQTYSLEKCSVQVLICLKNVVFVLDKFHDKLVPLNSTKDICGFVPILNQMQIKKFAISADEKFVYMIDFDTKLIYVGDY